VTDDTAWGAQTPRLAMDAEARKALEAILLVVDEPVDANTLAQVLEAPTEEVEATLRALRAEYVDQGRGFVLREVGGGWRLYTDPGAAPYVERFVLRGRSGRLSQAALETLAIIAYKQPVTRAQISEIRGVEADGACAPWSAAASSRRSAGRRSGAAAAVRDDGEAPRAARSGQHRGAAAAAGADAGGPPPPEPPPGGYKAARRELDALATVVVDAAEPEDGDELDEAEAAAELRLAALDAALAADGDEEAGDPPTPDAEPGR
jgi:segregation and condensation protein B